MRHSARLLYLGCSATHGRTVSASLRIIYDGGKKATSFKEDCSAVEALGPSRPRRAEGSRGQEDCKSSFKALGVGRAAGATRRTIADGGCPRRVEALTVLRPHRHR